MGNKPKSEDDRYLLPDEWKELKGCFESHEDFILFDLLQNCGLRITEGITLTPADFDFAKGVVNVKTLKRKGHPVFPLDVRPDLLDEVKKLAKGVKKDKPIWKGEYKTYYRRFKRAIKKAKLNGRLSPHSLRHLRGIRLVKATGGNLVEIARSLRHASTRTSEHYVHLSPERRKEIAKKTWEEE